VILLLLAGCLLAVLLFFAGARELAQVSGWRREVSVLLVDDGHRVRPSLLQSWDGRFRRTRLGGWVQRQLVLAGVERPPLVIAAAAVLGTLTICYLLWVTLAPLFGLLGLLVGAQVLRVYLARARNQRREEFVAQMPELARVLANATSAGLSLRTAIEMAADELGDPASTELRRIAHGMAFGQSLEASLNAVQERLPSREVSVLISTLLVSARSGGSLVSALRDIADTLDNRKEVRREIRTVLAQATATGYIVIGMGVALLFMLNTVRPGTVEKMTVTPLGQGALVLAGALYTVGALMVRRMTRIEP
jgi:tight adherence protein B